MEYHKILKIFEKIIVNLIIIVLSIIAMFVIWGFVQLNVQKKEYLNIFGYSLFSTETGSMSPTMEKGDIVIIKIGDEIREKDIIKKHMWPLTISAVPMCREAWIVTMADKWCSLMETFHVHKGHGALIEKLRKIEEEQGK